MIEHRITIDYHSQPQLYLKHLIDVMKTNYSQNISDWTNCSSSDETRFLACSTIWIQEDAKLNCEVVYIDENGQRITNETGFKLGDIYFNTRMVFVEQRLIQGGVRLGTVINKIVQMMDKDKKSDESCFGTLLFMVFIFIQSILILAFLSYSFLRSKTKKSTTTIIQSSMTKDQKDYSVIA